MPEYNPPAITGQLFIPVQRDLLWLWDCDATGLQLEASHHSCAWLASAPGTWVGEPGVKQSKSCCFQHTQGSTLCQGWTTLEHHRSLPPAYWYPQGMQQTEQCEPDLLPSAVICRRSQMHWSHSKSQNPSTTQVSSTRQTRSRPIGLFAVTCSRYGSFLLQRW